MAVERCDFYSDSEFAMAQQMEEEAFFNHVQEQEEIVQHQMFLNSLEHIALPLGITNAIAHLKEFNNQKENSIENLKDNEEAFSELEQISLSLGIGYSISFLESLDRINNIEEELCF